MKIFKSEWYRRKLYSIELESADKNNAIHQKEQAVDKERIKERTHTDIFVEEALNFTRRHPELNDTQMTLGGLAWGAMRALAECDNCPGKFRVPLNEDWSVLICRHCRNVWFSKTADPDTIYSLLKPYSSNLTLDLVKKWLKE